jgi:predicted enzyme related to lactoylglutathione lyase
VIYVTDLEQGRARVIDSGGRIRHDIYSFPGGRRFHFEDPAGNELAVWSDAEAPR